MGCHALFWSFLLSTFYLTTSANVINLHAFFDFDDVKVLDYKVVNTLRCNTSAPLTSDLSIAWMKDDKFLENSAKFEIKTDSLVIHRTMEDDIAKYTCVLRNKTSQNLLSRADIKTMGKPIAKIVQKLPQGAFIEGQKISLECVSQGKPIPDMEWKFENSTFAPGTEQPDRVKVTKPTPYSLLLQIDEAQMSDRGSYSCHVWNKASEELKLNIESLVFVRIKDKLAALWPFIGICAEVIVLCAIILVYERNRIKSELEESDTDISPEQKNTPDHGKDSVRQRK